MFFIFIIVSLRIKQPFTYLFIDSTNFLKGSCSCSCLCRRGISRVGKHVGTENIYRCRVRISVYRTIIIQKFFRQRIRYIYLQTNLCVIVNYLLQKSVSKAKTGYCLSIFMSHTVHNKFKWKHFASEIILWSRKCNIE